MKNAQVAKVFKSIARLLELKGENPFRVRAYEKGAQIVEGSGEDIEARAKADTLQELPGIGRDLAQKIKDIVETGTCAQYEKLQKEVPAGLLKMMEIPGLGPKSIKLFYEKLGISTIDELEKAAEKGKLKSLEGIKEKTEENILKGIALLKKGRERAPLYKALEVAGLFISALKKKKEVQLIEVAGSVRRKKETIKDVDILITSRTPRKIMEAFTALPYVKEILAKGQTKSSVISHDHGMQVDLRVVEEESFGSALLYFTGSKQFNIKLRQLGISKKLKINEYGVFSTTQKGEEKRLAGRTEKEIFKLMKLGYIPPELREERGEIELALKNALPKVIVLSDVKGDMHVHSVYSDGSATIEGVAQHAQKRGYRYIGVADHSQSLKIARGLSVERMMAKIREVKRVNRTLKNTHILCGTEVDILNDGSLDYPDSALKGLDFVIAAIHTGFKQTKAQLTKRIVGACKNKYVNIIAHPTGRLFGVREAYEVSFEEIIKAAIDNNVALEINCYPERMDLNDLHCMQAAPRGVKLALGTDAHAPDHMAFIEYGVSIARRGWLEKKDVINCWDLKKLQQWLKKK